MWHAVHLPARPAQRVAAAFACLLLVPWGPAVAQWGGAVGVASENIYRGVRLDTGPSWFADLHFVHDTRWVAGVGASAAQPPGRDAGTQFALYLDRRWRAGEDWIGKAGVLHYEAPGIDGDVRYDEANIAIGWRGRWQASLAWTPRLHGGYAGEAYGYGGSTHAAASALWFETSWHQPLAGRLAGFAGIGHADFHGVGRHDYRYGSAGLDWGSGPLQLQLARIWTGPSVAWHGLYYAPVPGGQRWTLALAWVFGG